MQDHRRFPTPDGDWLPQDPEHLYEVVVEFLRDDVPPNLDAAAGGMFGEPIGAESDESFEEGVAELERLEAIQEDMFDAVLVRLERLADAADAGTACEAIRAAEADHWVLPWLLHRACWTRGMRSAGEGIDDSGEVR